MALFLDSADLTEIRAAMDLGIYAGVTTNPTLLSSVPPAEMFDHLGEIAKVCRKSLYLQASGRTPEELERHALTCLEVAPGRTVLKIPMTAGGLKLCGSLSGRNIPVCVTALFSPLQVYAAARAGAHSAAVYLGRITRSGGDGVKVIEQAVRMLAQNGLATRVLAASIPDEAALAAVLSIPGVDVTIPFRLQDALIKHPGTDEALESFRQAPKRS